MFKNGKKDPLLEDVEVSDQETLAEQNPDELDEGIFASIKKGYNNGLKNGLKQKIKPEHHKSYNIDDVKSTSDATSMLKKAKQSGHTVNEDVDVDEAWDPANGPAQAVATVKAATMVGKKQPLRKGDKQNSDPMQKIAGSGAFKEDLDALVDSEATLSEAFREKAEVIFEAALQSKLTEHVERLEAEYAEQLAEETATIQSDLVEKIDGYLNYVVENWIEENKVAIENGLRTEIAESFMQALHGVFTEHYITVPDSKVDIVDELASTVDELEEQLNSALERGIELTEQVKSLTREAVIRESATDLSEAQADKLATLSEGVEFESAEAFAKKVSTIKESYFKKEAVKQSTDEAQHLTEDMKTIEVSPVMARYLAALKK